MLSDFARTLRADYAVNPFPDGRITLFILRAGQSLFERPGVVPFLLRRLARLADFVWTRGFIGADLPFQVQVGPGLYLPHGGRGVVLHPSVRIGANVSLYHQVTVGVSGSDQAGVIGNDVFIGAGAKILGEITVGDDCRIGANAVVLRDVPAGATAVGVPAVVKQRRQDPAGLAGDGPEDP